MSRVKSRSSGKAQATTTASRKLYDLVKATGEYSIEAWVAPANVAQGTKKKCTDAGMDDFLQKPFTFNNLTAIIKKHLQKNEPSPVK